MVRAGDLTLAYREAGAGAPVLLLHGWPTSSFLWRNVMPPIAVANRVIALDLPGFGASEKPLGTRYGFELFERAIDDFLAALEIDEVGLAVHDLGGPIGVHWALGRPGRVTKLAVLNTLLYPELSGAVLEFVKALSSPELRDQFTGPGGPGGGDAARARRSGQPHRRGARGRARAVPDSRLAARARGRRNRSRARGLRRDRRAAAIAGRAGAGGLRRARRDPAGHRRHRGAPSA